MSSVLTSGVSKRQLFDGQAGHHFATGKNGLNGWAKVLSFTIDEARAVLSGTLKISERNGVSRIFFCAKTGVSANIVLSLDLSSDAFGFVDSSVNRVANSVYILADHSGSVTDVEVWVYVRSYSRKNFAELQDFFYSSGTGYQPPEIIFHSSGSGFPVGVPSGVSITKSLADFVESAKVAGRVFYNDANLTSSVINSRFGQSHFEQKLATVGAGDVGSYVWGSNLTMFFVGFGSIVSGSNIKPAHVGYDGGVQAGSSSTLPGTWRVMGYVHNSSGGTLFLRVS